MGCCKTIVSGVVFKRYAILEISIVGSPKLRGDLIIISEGEYLDKVVKRTSLERTAKEGKSPVFENYLYAPCYFS